MAKRLGSVRAPWLAGGLVVLLALVALGCSDNGRGGASSDTGADGAADSGEPNAGPNPDFRLRGRLISLP